MGRWGDVIYIARLVPKFKEQLELAVRVSRPLGWCGLYAKKLPNLLRMAADYGQFST